MDILLLVLIGFIAGIVAGFFGIGGGIVMVPTLIYIFNTYHDNAVGTSIFAIIFISLASSITHWRYGNSRMTEGLILGGTGVFGAQLGAGAIKWVPLQIFIKLFAVILILHSIKMFNEAIAIKKSSKNRTSFRTISTRENTIKYYSLFAFVGLIAGIVSSFFGIGGGIVMVPVMIFLMNFKSEVAVGTSLIAIVIITISAAIAHSQIQNINYLFGIILGSSGIFGAILGANLLNKIEMIEKVKKRNIRWVFFIGFGMILILTTIKMLL